MHINQIVVDGFKSYAHRTVIAGFDPHFNAITGLNGSGKSNILDSICFVLGITNLSHVRAGNLTELVYKQGQAGINKATVTIVFDNTDTSSSPVGFEQDKEVTVTRQVLIGGKSKYLINGRTAPAGKVSNLFHSVQLNVNNPHFLIMQGRITKVLNMKPHEILGMVEEAAGTRMYETKRLAALKTIDKKQMKLDELNSVLTEEITPTLVRLRDEKQNYLKWSKNNADIERIERFVTAYDYYKAQETLAQSEEDALKIEEDMRQAEENVSCSLQEIQNKEEEIENLSNRLNCELNEAQTNAKTKEEDISKDLVKVTAAWKNCKDVAKASNIDLSTADTSVIETKNAITLKDEEISRENSKIEKAKSALETAENNLNRLQDEYQNMCAGISSDQGDAGMTLPDQISKAHNDASAAETRSKQAAMKIKHLANSIKVVEKDMKREESSAKKLSTKKEKASNKVSELEAKISKIDFSEEVFNSLENEKIHLENNITTLKETVQTLTAQLEGRLAFNYSDPVRGFDRSKVKGLVARLITVKKHEYSLALEVVAGGKLFNVIVDDAITGKALLDRGKLRRRVTIVPLDKIASRRISDEKVSLAASIAKKLGTVSSPAIDIVGFDEEIRNAIEYVFGSSLVVNGMDAANKICDATKTRTVTEEGDVYDPSGTISGGSNKNLSTLSKLTELLIATKDLEESKARLQIINSKWQIMKSYSETYFELSDSLELAKAELESVVKHLSQTSYGMLSEKFQSMMDEINTAKEEMNTMEKEKNKKWKLYNDLRAKEEDLTKEREERLKNFDNILKAAKADVVKATKAFRDIESVLQQLKFEGETLQKDLNIALEAVESAKTSLSKASSEEVDLQIKVGEQKALYDEAKENLNAINLQIEEVMSKLKSLNKEKKQLMKKAEIATIDSKKLSVKVESFEKGKQNAERIIITLEKKYGWIENERKFFGVTGGDYDFASLDPSEMNPKLKKLKEEQTSLARKINKKVMGMIEKAEGEYTELLRKRKVVENDKKKIQAVIESLDEKKKMELQRTWVKVNVDFGSIFSTLLPGASAKLEPPEGMQAWEGLEVKVAFGDVWKESLSELSGGQRSLLALSLILSLLLFKPAPMYILDEVDAALDLSHTQNIGNMLKTHFSQSQFIVVSLKEGMFNNANVIFRTKFVEGVSTVTRTIGIGKSTKEKALKSSNQKQNMELSSPARKRGTRQRRVEISDDKEN